MNKQEIFDKVITRLFDGRGQSASNGSCRYRSDDGNSCAVGCLIPDDMYDPAMDSACALDRNFGHNLNDGTAIDSIMKYYPDLLNHLGGDENLKLLKDLQLVHDYSSNWDVIGMPNINMKIKLREIAIRYGLDHRTGGYLYYGV